MKFNLALENSLFMRMALLLLGGASSIIVICAIFWSLLASVGEQRYRKQVVVDSVDQMVNVYFQLKSISPEKREKWLEQYSWKSTGPIDIALISEKNDNFPDFNEMDDVLSLLDQYLKKKLGMDVPFKFRVSYMEPEDFEMEQVLETETDFGKTDELALVDFPLINIFDIFDWQIDDDDLKSVAIKLQLDENTGIIFNILGLYESIMFWSVPSFLSIGFIGIFLLSMLILSLIFTWWINRPLKRITRIAEQLGKDITKKQVFDFDAPKEIQSIANALKLMQKEIQNQITEKSRIFSAISHDLKTPITRLQLRVELLESDENRVKFKKDLDLLETSVLEALDYARFGYEKISTCTVDMDSLIYSVVDDMGEMGTRVKISGNCSYPIKGQVDQLKRCLKNIIDNALLYGSQAELEILGTEKYVMITIKDNGPGIPKEEQVRVFDPFYRVDKSRNLNVGGSGLGLSISKKIVEKHGGSIALENRTGQKGLKVRLKFVR